MCHVGLGVLDKACQECHQVKKQNFLHHVPVGKHAGTTAVKQLTKLWHRINRVTVSDSAFSSIVTAMKMNKLFLGYVSYIKTTTKLFPSNTLEEVQLPNGYVNFFTMIALNERVKLLVFT